MQKLLRLEDLPVTNQCVVVCDLQKLETPSSTAWMLLTGTQDEVGKELALLTEHLSISRLDDFGGVCKTFLCEGDVYVEAPRRTKPGAGVFSFTPKKRLLDEAADMARVARASGYSLLVLTLQKHDKFGKIWVLSAMLEHLESSSPLTYYEDTNSVVDELKSLSVSDRVIAVHVVAPGYENEVSRLADRVVSQRQYQDEVLA